MDQPPSRWNYHIGLLFMMTMTNAIVVLDRFGINYLAPYIVDDLGISNASLGLLSSGLSVSVAISGVVLARLADASGRRKQILVSTLIVFSLVSALSGLAPSFAALLMARILLGVPEGPIPAIAQSIVVLESPPRLRGFSMGLVQQLGASLVGVGIGPILFTHVADAWGWRMAFLLSCAPGLLLALAIALFMRPVRDAEPGPRVARTSLRSTADLRAILGSANFVRALLICGFMSAWMISLGVFTPIHLVKVHGLKPTDMGLVLSGTGLAGAAAGVLLPWLSDKIGRKPMLVATALWGVITPLAILHTVGSPLLLVGGMLVGALAIGGMPFSSILAAESVAPHHYATAIALIIANAELMGGMLAPAIAGQLADWFGLAAPFYFATAMVLIAALLSLTVKETAPGKTSKAATPEPSGVTS
ncbi:MAG TPA: MFS transporter [Sphingomonadaceae bacterium]|nr:MFS transporter [Sphingomonadaceae bacterium]